MIVGSYWQERSEVTVDLDVLSLSGSRATISAVLDTEFTGFLLLSLQQVQELGVPLVDYREMELADGTIRPVARYEVSLVWNGRPKTVFALANDATKPVVGMKLLHRCLVTLELVEGGSITIERA